METLTTLLNPASSDDDFLAAWERLGRPGYFLERLRRHVDMRSADVLTKAHQRVWDPDSARFAEELLAAHFTADQGVSPLAGEAEDNERILIPPLLRCLQGQTTAAR